MRKGLASGRFAGVAGDFARAARGLRVGREHLGRRVGFDLDRRDRVAHPEGQPEREARSLWYQSLEESPPKRVSMLKRWEHHLFHTLDLTRHLLYLALRRHSVQLRCSSHCDQQVLSLHVLDNFLYLGGFSFKSVASSK